MVRQWDLIIANPLTQIEQSHAYICPIPYNYQITYVRWCIESDLELHEWNAWYKTQYFEVDTAVVVSKPLELEANIGLTATPTLYP